jgi:hypothetical protein
MHVWGRPLQDFGSPDRDRYLPLQSVPAAIGQCLLDYHHQAFTGRAKLATLRATGALDEGAHLIPPQQTLSANPGASYHNL